MLRRSVLGVLYPGQWRTFGRPLPRPIRAAFTFTSEAIGHDIEVLVLKSRNAIAKLRQIGATAVTVVGLRNIDRAIGSPEGLAARRTHT